MKNQALISELKPPESVEEVLSLARYAPGVQVAIRPRLTLEQINPGRLYPAFRLHASFTVSMGGKTTSFEKTYAKGHEVAPPKAAANGFLIANTRLHREVRRLRQVGVKCEVEIFVLSELLPGTDLSELLPRPPYYLNQFAILASIGAPIQVAMTTQIRRVGEEKGAAVYELCALYSIHCRDRDYRLETHHGRFREGTGVKQVAKLREQALQYLEREEQYNLRRVDVNILMGPLWPELQGSQPSPVRAVAEAEAKKSDPARLSLHLLPG